MLDTMDSGYTTVKYDTIVHTAHQLHANDTLYFALSGQLWGVFRELYKEKWPRESALYNVLGGLTLHGTPLLWSDYLVDFKWCIFT